MATSKQAPRELDPFAKGKIANMHAELGCRLSRRRPVRGGGPRVRAGAGALPDVRRHPHRARQHPPRDGRPDRRDPRARAGARREPALRRRAPEAGARLLRGRRGARTPPPSGAPCWRPMPRTARRRCTWRCSTRRPPPTSTRGRRNEARAHVLTFTPSPERFIVEEIPAYPPDGRRRAHLPLDREARPDDVRRHRAHGARVRRRAARHRLRGAEGQARRRPASG